MVEGAQPLAQLHVEAPVADGPSHQGVSRPLVTCRHHLQVPRAVLTTGIEGRDGGGHLHLGTPIPAGRRPGRRNKPPPPLAGRHLRTTSSPGRSAGRPSKTCGHRLPSAPAGTRLRSPPAPRTAVSTWRGCWALGTAWLAGQSQPLGCGLGILHPHHPSAPERAPRGAWDGNGGLGP